MAFSQETMDFLSQNFMNNSRDWYHSHKAEYKKFVAEPFSEFITRLEPALHGIDGQMLVDPRKFSRLFRDMRFVAGGPIFHANVWCAFSRANNEKNELPGFYFDLSPSGCEYGFGYYRASSKTMEAIRTMITDGDKAYLAARKAYEGQSVFAIGGDTYKKERYPDAPKADADWLNRRSIYFHAREENWETIFSEDLADLVAERFLLLAPVYQFFMKAEER